jgi:hypothetical protein
VSARGQASTRGSTDCSTGGACAGAVGIASNDSHPVTRIEEERSNVFLQSVLRVPFL